MTMADIDIWNPLDMSHGDESFGSSSSSCNALSTPIPMAKRISAYKPPTHNVPHTLRSTTTAATDSMSDKIDELANRIAAFQNSKTTTNGDDGKVQPTMKDIVFQSPKPSRRPTSTRLFPSEAIPNERIRINEMGFPTSSNTMPTCALTPTWKPVSLENKTVMSSTSDEVKFSAAILTQSPQVISEKCDEDDDLEAVEITVIKLDEDDDDEVNESIGDDNNVKQVEKDCINSSAELPIFTYHIPPKGGVVKKLNVSDTSGQNAIANTSCVSISFDSLPAEYLDTTWNLPPEESNDPRDVSAIEAEEEMDPSDDTAGKEEANEGVNEGTQSLVQRRRSSLIAEARVALQAKRAERQVKVEVTENQSFECSIEEYKDLPRDLFQHYDQTQKELPNEDLVSPTGVDNFVTDDDASKFNFADEKNELVISAITRNPEETTIISDFPYSIEGESLNDRSVDTITLQKGDIDCFDAKKLIISKKALIGVIESSLGLIADKFAEGYDLVASEL